MNASDLSFTLKHQVNAFFWFKLFHLLVAWEYFLALTLNIDLLKEERERERDMWWWGQRRRRRRQQANIGTCTRDWRGTTRGLRSASVAAPGEAKLLGRRWRSLSPPAASYVKASCLTTLMQGRIRFFFTSSPCLGTSIHQLDQQALRWNVCTWHK